MTAPDANRGRLGEEPVLVPVLAPTVAAVRRIYVAGPMNGIADFNYPAFEHAGVELRQRGLRVALPTGPLVEGKPYDWYLRRAIAKLITCEAVALLPGWQQSRGARVEVAIAGACSMLVYPLEQWLALRPVTE